MILFRPVVIALFCASAMLARDASAENCVLPFPWLCQRIYPTQPRVQSAPLRILPDNFDEPSGQVAPAPQNGTLETISPTPESKYAIVYAAMRDGQFAIPAVRLSDINPNYIRKTVYYPTREQSGTIVIDTRNHFLYFIQDGGRAIRYGIGVGRQGFGWSGMAIIHEKRKWPDWYPPKEMIQRQPELMSHLRELPSGLGMSGGLSNPLGARAMYLWQNSKDTLYRIHGTNEPWTIGKSVSSGCIRMINQDAIDLYQRAPVDTKVVVLSLGRFHIHRW